MSESITDSELTEPMLRDGTPFTFTETSKTALARQVHLKLGPHAGVRAVTRKLTELGITWPSMAADIHLVIAGCVTCAQRRPIRFAHGPYTAQLATKVWENVHIDLGELERNHNGNKFFLVVTDRFSNYIVAAALKNKEASTVRSSLSTIFSALGVPTRLKSDNGTEFIDSHTQQWIKDLGTSATRSLPYHKEGNGAAENAVKRVKRALQLLRASFPNTPWSDLLVSAITSLNNTPSQASQLTPHEVLHIRKQQVVAEWETQLVAQFQRDILSSHSSYAARAALHPQPQAWEEASQADREAVQVLQERWQRRAQTRRTISQQLPACLRLVGEHSAYPARGVQLRLFSHVSAFKPTGLSARQTSEETGRFTSSERESRSSTSPLHIAGLALRK
jgi:transposase InsO family protein